MIIVATHSVDVGADLVIRHLSRLQRPFTRLNSDKLGTRDCHFCFDDRPALVVGGYTIEASNVNALWARRFARAKILGRLPPQYATFVGRELAQVMEAFFEAVPGLQVNSYEADRRAGNRLNQARHAASVGFLVPKTLVTQNADRAVQFIRKHAAVVTKAISYGGLDDEGTCVAYTKPVTASADFSGLDSGPALFQKSIPKKHEWRVTTVAERLFAARTRMGANVDPHDWRRSTDVMSIFERAELPASVANMVRELCYKTGVLFGTHDLIETPRGDFYFLETNPAGQWGWLEICLELPIGEALAELLSSKATAST